MFLLINILRLKVTLFQGNNLRGKTLLYSNFCCKTGFVKKLLLFISKSTNFYFFLPNYFHFIYSKYLQNWISLHK